MVNSKIQFALVIPTLREAANLPALLDRIRPALEPLRIPCEILIVDDDSRDGTPDVVNAIAAADPRVRLLVRRGERGLAGAVMHGWRHTSADVLGVMDGDLQHPPELLPRLLAEISRGNDLAIASRYAKGGSLGGWNPLRTWLSAAAVAATMPLQPGPIRARDPMSGFFLVRRECLPHSILQPHGFKLLLEILVRGSVHRISEIPFTFGERKAGSSKARLKVAREYLALLLKLYAERWSTAKLAVARD
ncbi:MAG: polyprenol monophosphomannose synthase [Acidobacteriota bacterium]